MTEGDLGGGISIEGGVNSFSNSASSFTGGSI